MADECSDLPDDILVPVLQRLPTSSRRRFRLVCKHWLDLIGKRTPEMKVRTKILAFVTQRGSSRALVFPNNGGSPRHSWTFPCSHYRGFVNLVGSCNGLLCLHENKTFGVDGGSLSTICVTNPITGEKFSLPPVPTPRGMEHLRPLGKYTFGYHPVTGEYKVVHVPCRRHLDAVQVFTLGGASWREVLVHARVASCSPSCKAVSIDGFTYWLNKLSSKVMALDLKDERVTCLDTPPALRTWTTDRLQDETRWQLTNVHARLGIALGSATGVEVWVLERGGGEEQQQPRWILQYTLANDDAFQVDHGGCWITAPHLTHRRFVVSESGKKRRRLYRHLVVHGSAHHDRKSDERLRPLEVPELSMNGDGTYSSPTEIFAYVETREPLPTNVCEHGGDG